MAQCGALASLKNLQHLPTTALHSSAAPAYFRRQHCLRSVGSSEEISESVIAKICSAAQGTNEDSISLNIIITLSQSTRIFSSILRVPVNFAIVSCRLFAIGDGEKVNARPVIRQFERYRNVYNLLLPKNYVCIVVFEPDLRSAFLYGLTYFSLYNANLKFLLL